MQSGKWTAGIAIAVGAIGLAAPASAQKSADTLRIATRDAIPDKTPYYNSLRSGLVLSHQAWDQLVYRDPETFAIKPLLATSWKYIDDTTIEFALRQGVKFHNGDAFTSDDVVYTINSILTDKQVSVPSNYAFLDSASKVDDFTVRVKLKKVFPAALEYFSMVLPIMPKAYREKVGVEAYSKAPVGTGPYKITRVNGVTQIDLERFDGYYADSPKGRPAISKVVIKEVADASTELSFLLAGQVDWIWGYNSDQFDNISKVPTLQAMRAESMRVGYLSMDAAGRTAPGNPLTNLKVRQAIEHAIDREAFAKQLVQGGSRPLHAPCYPTQFGCDQDAAVKYAYDPARAKALLAEAGFPNGFEIELVSYILPAWTAAVQGWLKAVGITARVTQLQVGAAVQRALEGKNPLYLGNWGSYSINDISAFLPYFFTGGGDDYARDPDLQKLVTAGGATADVAERKKNYTAAIKHATEQAYWMPLTTYVTNYATSKNLDFKPYPDELPRHFLSKWK